MDKCLRRDGFRNWNTSFDDGWFLIVIKLSARRVIKVFCCECCFLWLGNVAVCKKLFYVSKREFRVLFSKCRARWGPTEAQIWKFRGYKIFLALFGPTRMVWEFWEKPKDSFIKTDASLQPPQIGVILFFTQAKNISFLFFSWKFGGYKRSQKILN